MNLHLSKILIERSRPLVPYEWHQMLWHLFPSPPGAPRPYLFRVEEQAAGSTQILLQSNRQPLFGAAVDDALVRVLDTRPVKPQLEVGQHLRFRLTVNPTVQRRVLKPDPHAAGHTRCRKARVPLPEEEQYAWLAARIGDAAQMEQAQIRERQTLHFRTKAGAAGTVVTVRIEGTMTVRDPQQLTGLLARGIGPAKSMGCGLLSLAPG